MMLSWHLMVSDVTTLPWIDGRVIPFVAVISSSSSRNRGGLGTTTLGPMAEEVRWPVFLLRLPMGQRTPSAGVLAANGHFAELTRRILTAVGVGHLAR